MFVNMGFATPRPGKEKELAETMRSFGKALEGMPGLLDAFVLAESDGKTLVGVSLWHDRASFEAAMKKVRPPAPSEPPEQMRATPPTIRQFESV